MSRKQVIFRIIIILIISLILVCIFLWAKTYQGHKNIELMDSYIKEHHLQDKIKTRDFI